MIREAASKTRLCKVSRPICIISVVAPSLSLPLPRRAPSPPQEEEEKTRVEGQGEKEKEGSLRLLRGLRVGERERKMGF